VPEVERYRPPPPELDFLTFEEADRLIAAAQEDQLAARGAHHGGDGHSVYVAGGTGGRCRSLPGAAGVSAG